ncbi:rhomboid family protein/intramembrane serine protease [Halalkaliarchaeum desulfuricum]|uniref:Rhomboid family protein/intramembrane serine protease n=1 Tax=Halalkaliarchaeum desulfuricum TaxID=2055893 RepID=A0A343TH99_9EURY|nr:rhomboid family intramembrane serine protease [Halalkaliarchaeum desulfuricum]AUX08471.1 rhomboid family protein/intramembrane serine protease [Halalkaliarchaeum desulfuricum]
MVTEWFPLQRLAVVAAALLAFAIVYAVDRPRGAWGRTLRSRLLLGLPWGTLVSLGFVLLVYLFVQGGAENWHNPVVLPFRAWSYFYPLGMVTAGFSHASAGHLIGNLLGALVLGTLAEYAWGHFPQSRGTSSFSSWKTNPYVRAFLIVPGAVIGAGLLTSLFSIGPVIGFSGVVFAFGGFALAFYPLGTIVALSASTLVRLVYNAMRHPELVASADWVYQTPSWATIAIQGHALGLFVGLLVGLYLRRRRGDLPSALRLGTGVLLYGAARSLWAVYWYRGGETYVLYRAIGLALVILLATLVVLAGATRDEPLSMPTLPAMPSTPSIPALPSVSSRLSLPSVSTSNARSGTTPAAIGFVLLLMGAAMIAGPAIPVNLVTADEEPLPGDPIEVRDYQVTYAEDITDGMVDVIDVELFGETTTVETSGVIVKSQERHLWTTAVSKNRLRGSGQERIGLGGLGWRDSVSVHRTGWQVVGGDRVYRVELEHDEDRQVAFTSTGSHAQPRVDGRNVTVVSWADGFHLLVAHDGGIETVQIPETNESVEAMGVQFAREEDDLFAERGETRVRIAAKETYRR